MTTNSEKIAVNFFKGVVSAFIAPPFAFLTGTWYTANQQVIRTLIWGFGSMFIVAVYAQISHAISQADDRGLDSTGLSWYQLEGLVTCIICMLLAGVAYFFISTPAQARWMSPQEKIRFQNRQDGWRSTPWAGLQVCVRPSTLPYVS